MTMERMPTDHVSSSRARTPENSDAPALFDDTFMQTARNMVEETPQEAPRLDPRDDRLDFSRLEETTTGPIHVDKLSDEILEKRFEDLECRADDLADKRGISIALALEQLDADGIVAERHKRETEARRQAEKQAALQQASTNSIAINEMRQENAVLRRAQVAASYRDGSFEQQQALTQFDALEVVKAQRRKQNS